MTGNDALQPEQLRPDRSLFGLLASAIQHELSVIIGIWGLKLDTGDPVSEIEHQTFSIGQPVYPLPNIWILIAISPNDF